MSGEPPAASNPYAVTTLELAPTVPPDVMVVPRWFHPVVVGLILYLVIAAGLACIEIETILATGPILFLFGVVMAAATWPGSRRRLRFIAWGSLGFPILCVSLINLFGLGPADAQLPIGGLCIVFAAAMITALLRVRRLLVAPPGDRGATAGSAAESSESLQGDPPAG